MFLTTKLFNIIPTLASFQGIVDDDIKTVSSFLNLKLVWSHLAILASQLNSSHCAPVDNITTLSGGILSTSAVNLRTHHLGAFKYPSSLHISTLFIIDLHSKKTTLSYFIALSIICIILPTFDAKVAIIILDGAVLIIFSKLCQIIFSDIAHPFLSAHRLSHI